MATTGFAPASGAELAWTAEGDGTPVLLVHAGVADQRMWEPVSARLRGGHMVVRYDMRGFGMSRFHSGAFSPAADAVAVLDALERSSAHVAGCSYGALIALELAVSHSERVSSLTLFAPPQPDLDWSDDIAAFGNAEDAALSAGRLEEAVELNLSMWVDRPGSASSSRGLRSLVADMQRRAFDLQTATPIEPEDNPAHSLAGLQAVSSPTRIVIGALDHPDFQRSADNLAGAIPRARVQRVSDVGHLLPLENDAVAADAIATTIREATELRPGDDRRDCKPLAVPFPQRLDRLGDAPIPGFRSLDLLVASTWRSRWLYDNPSKPSRAFAEASGAAAESGGTVTSRGSVSSSSSTSTSSPALTPAALRFSPLTGRRNASPRAATVLRWCARRS